MVDRLFAAVLLAVTLGYGLIAFFMIKAPFQYDPLGPESWPRILACVAVVCLVQMLWRPDVDSFDTDRPTWIRLALVTVALAAYAELYEPLGYVLSTLGFCTLVARMLGADWLRAGLFGLAAGVLGYLIGAGLLNLNLPAGPLPRI